MSYIDTERQEMSLPDEHEHDLLESRMMRKGAPRDAVLNPWHSQEGFGGGPLGHPMHLKAKAGGDKSLSDKQGVSEDADAAARQGPRETANARLPAPQSPAGQAAPPSSPRLLARLSGAVRSTFAGRRLRLAGDRSRSDARGCRGRLRRARDVQPHRNAGSPTGREPYGDGVLVVVGGGESLPQGEGGQVS
jgi:hypothetical protein